jgi:hypothetical protein
MNVPDLMGYIAFMQAAYYTERFHVQDVIKQFQPSFVLFL